MLFCQQKVQCRSFERPARCFRHAHGLQHSLTECALSGLPTLVARRMMQNTAGLIGRSVNSAADAAQAAADGASFVVLEVGMKPCSLLHTHNCCNTLSRRSLLFKKHQIWGLCLCPFFLRLSHDERYITLVICQ